MLIDIIIAELRDYGKALRKEDRDIYESLLKLPLKKAGAISYTSSINAWAFLLLSIILEQEKNMREREKKMAKEDESLANGRLQERELSCALDKDS
ncbi:hypothetical protein GF351_01975 [Candidatus Woesearchaeota archaeon]|nr:hypothetical protein [Candidatus Woesearchaeota archaeon]